MKTIHYLEHIRLLEEENKKLKGYLLDIYNDYYEEEAKKIL
jgi:hypothetical protein